MFICAADDDGSVYEVPFSMKKVLGSFIGEVLYTELVSEISSAKKLKIMQPPKLPMPSKTTS